MTIDTQTLSHLADNAPLDQTLQSIVTHIGAAHPGMHVVLLLAGGSKPFHVISSSSALPAGYFSEICSEKHDDGLLADLRLHAARHNLHVCGFIAIPNQSGPSYGCIAVFKPAATQEPGAKPDLEDAALLAAIAVQRDHERKSSANVKEALRENQTIMRLAIEGSGTGIWDRNVVTGKIDYSTTWKTILGYEENEISNQIEDAYHRIHPDDLAFVQLAMQTHFERKTDSYSVEHRIRCKDGRYKWICSKGKVVERDAAGKPLRMVGTTVDVNAMRTLSEQLKESVDLVTSLTNEVPGLVYQYRQLPNGESFFTYVSEGIDEIYEMSAESALQNADAVHRLIYPDDLHRYQLSLVESASNLMPWHLEYRVMLPKQGLQWREGNARPRRLPDGSVLWHGFVMNITTRKNIEIELEAFATIDFLTQIPNRRYFIFRMEEALARLKRTAGARASVLMCDLDYFKHINDRYGHAVGDQVLKHFAETLAREVRKTDTVGRVGGEEFAAVLTDMGIDGAAIFAKRVQQRFAETPLVIDGETLFVTLSIGVATIEADDINTDAALSRSDLALYRAKRNGRNRIEVHVP